MTETKYISKTAPFVNNAVWFKTDRLEISSTFAKENTATLKQNRLNA